MISVYILIEYSYDGNTIYGVFSSKEKAQWANEQLPKKLHRSILEMALDELSKKG